MMQRDLDQDVYIPLTLAQSTFGDAIIRLQQGSVERKEIELSEIWLKAESIDEVEQLAKITGERRQDRARDANDVEIKAPSRSCGPPSSSSGRSTSSWAAPRALR